MPKATKIRSKAIITGFDQVGNVVYQQRFDLDKYYDGTPDVIDSAEFRRKKGVRHIFGALFNMKGELFQAFVIFCAADGKYLHSMAKHADGTVTSD
jgi:hypothetical protein